MNDHGFRITQHELADIFELEKTIQVLQKQVDEKKGNLIPLLKEKVPIEFGRFDVRLDRRVGRSVPWKVLVLNRLGYEAAEAFKKQFPVHTWLKLTIIEHAVPPLWKAAGADIETSD